MNTRICRKKRPSSKGFSLISGSGRVIEPNYHDPIYSLKMKVMKKIIIGLCLLSVTTFTYANNRQTPERKVPLHVVEAFHKHYPDATTVHWTYTNGRWNANFHKMDGNMDMNAGYNAKGHRIDSRYALTRTAVPDKVVEQVDVRYPGQYEHHYTKIERPMKRDLYRVRVRKQGVYRTLYMDSNGHERDYASR
jgi:hypothetical protein